MGWLRRTPLAAARWVVIDCETSGLDPARDRLLALGAVGVRGRAIEAADSYAALLRQDEASPADNILVHGIGADAQRAGRPAREVLEEFGRFLDRAAPAAFPAPFDAEVLRRARAREKLPALKSAWLDLAALAPALYPELGRSCHSLDEWLDAFGIACAQRHDALADAFATAQLLLVLLAEAGRQGLRSVEDLAAAARNRRWLAR